jgi:thiol:disulfide interchange protein
MADETNSPRSKRSRVNIKFWIIVYANIQGHAILAVIIWIATQIGGSFYLNLLICLLGLIIGWMLGTLASPYTKTESVQFLSLSQAISAFISGYLISKLDRFLEVALFTKEGEIQNLAWSQAGLFTATLLVTTLVTFINRTYYQAAKAK